MALVSVACAACVCANAQEKKQEFVMPKGYAGITHEMSEFYEPVPPVVTPGQVLSDGGFTAPSDAIVLFDGKDLSQWESAKGGPAEWDVHDGVFTVNKKKGDIQTKQEFENFQLHIEWMVPETSRSNRSCAATAVSICRANMKSRFWIATIIRLM